MGLFTSLFKKKKKERVKHVAKTKTKTKTKKKAKKSPKNKEISDHQAMKAWKKVMEDFQNHPLTQAKVMNEEMLNSVMSHLENIHKEVNEVKTRMDRLEVKQDKTLDIVKKGPKMPKEKRRRIKLSTPEQRILDYIAKKKEVQARPLATALKISRSNASLKLNKLHSVGYVVKRQEGKETYFKLKDKNRLKDVIKD